MHLRLAVMVTQLIRYEIPNHSPPSSLRSLVCAYLEGPHAQLVVLAESEDERVILQLSHGQTEGQVRWALVPPEHNTHH